MKRPFLLTVLFLACVMCFGTMKYLEYRHSFQDIRPYAHYYELNVPEPETLLDINHASAAKFAKLPGVSRSLAEQIVEFRKQNGDFQEISDLSACMPETLLEQVEGLLCCIKEEPTEMIIPELPETAAEPEITVTETEPVTESATQPETPEIVQTETIAEMTEILTEDSEPEEIAEILFPLELNLASFEELCAIPGIGEVTAQNILDYRDAHGGFLNCLELLEVSGIGETRYGEILPYVYLETEYPLPEPEEFTEPAEPPQETSPEIPMINLNTASKEDLLLLPDCDEALADEIIALRDRDIHIFHNILEITLSEHVTTALFYEWEHWLAVDDDGSTQIPYVRPAG